MCLSPIIQHISKECIGEKATSFVQGEIKCDSSWGENMHADNGSPVDMTFDKFPHLQRLLKKNKTK